MTRLNLVLLGCFVAACGTSQTPAADAADAGGGGAQGEGGASSDGGASGDTGGKGAGGNKATGGKSSGNGGGSSAGGAPDTNKPLPPSQIPPVDPNAVVVPNLDSAIIKIDPVDGAKDYRAFVISDGVEVLTDASGDFETVKNANIFCAGQKQLAGPKLAVPEVMKQIEVKGITDPVEFVVEAIDRLCPSTGLWGRNDQSIDITSPDAIQFLPELIKPVPISSEATIRAKYDGSMIFNGHGPNQQLGQPADQITPKVLKRWKVKVAPLDATEAAKRKTATFFEDFAKDDPFQWVSPGPGVFRNDDDTFHGPEGYGFSYAVYQNSKFLAYATNTETVKGNHIFYDHGQLNMILPDADQDVMGTVMAIPKTLAHFSDNGFVHVTFESSTNSTARRYWWLSMCGADKAGETMGADGLLTKHISLGAGFWNPDGRNPSVAGWNCLLVFPHDGLVGAQIPAGSKAPAPQSSVIVAIHKSNAPVYQTGVNVSPQQLNSGYAPSWYRQMKGGQVTEKGVLDELIGQSPRVHFDFYVSRQRVIMYVNGEQRMCNDFGPQKLTMAEAAVGFNDALYHSSAEHTELTADFADRSGQLFYLQNTIFADQHSFDNVGFEENVGLPSGFTEGDCYTYKP